MEFSFPKTKDSNIQARCIGVEETRGLSSGAVDQLTFLIEPPGLGAPEKNRIRVGPPKPKMQLGREVPYSEQCLALSIQIF